MKKLLLFAIIALSVNLFSQSIPNGGFESWNNYSFENPQFYSTSNFESRGPAGNPGPINVTKATDAFAGSYAIKLLSTSTATLDPSYAYFSNGNPGATNFTGGIPYSQKPNGLRFYYKCNIMPGDTALVLAWFKKSGTLIGRYIYKITGTKSSYTLFNVNFSPALPVSPDTILFASASSNALLNYSINGSFLQIDSVSYKGVISQPLKLNGNFENWYTVSTDRLNNWYGNYMKKSTDVYSGNSALELQTLLPDFGSSQARTGYASTSMPSYTGPKLGYPFSSLIDTLYFYYKYIPGHPIDSALATVICKKNGAYVPMGGNQVKLGLSPVYKLLKFPIQPSIAPDTLMVEFSSSKYPIQNIYAGSSLKIDNLYLYSQKIPISNFTVQTNACVGQSLQLTDLSFNMPNAWAWITPGANIGSSTLQNPTIIYNTPGTKTISMLANNQFGSGALVTTTITVFPVPFVSVTSTLTPCGGSSVTLYASGANSYTWSTAQTTSSIVSNVTTTTTYTVLGASNGCTNTGVGIVIVPSPATPQICLVTADSLGVNNQILWDKTSYSKVDSFIVYRETPTVTNTLTGNYTRIGALSYNALSLFIDTARSKGGFVNGDPRFTSYKYKLQIRDSCGNYGSLSPYHQTIFVQDQQNGNFNWNPYAIEGQSSPVSTYVLTRRDIVTGTTSTVAATSSYLLSDPYYNVFYPNNIKWFVDAVGFNCNPSLKLSGISVLKTKTKSNQCNDRTFPSIGIKENTYVSFVKAYPNPAKETIYVELDNVTENTYLELVNVIGQKYVTYKATQRINAIVTSDLASGIYFLNIKQNNKIVTVKKVVIE